MPPENISFADTKMIAKTVVDMYDKGVIDKVVLISTAFVNNLSRKSRVFSSCLLRCRIRKILQRTMRRF